MVPGRQVICVVTARAGTISLHFVTLELTRASMMI